MECHCILRNIQDLFFDGKTPYERRFESPFESPVVPFGAMVENHPILRKTTPMWSKSVARYVPRLCFVGGRNLERRHFDRTHCRIGRDGRIRKSTPEG